MAVERNGANGASANGRYEILLRAGYPYEQTLGRRLVTFNPIDLAVGKEGRIYCLGRGPFETGGPLRILNWEDEDLGVVRRRPAEPNDRPAEADCGWIWPAGIVCDADERIIVSDEADHTITIATHEQDVEIARWGEHGSAPGQLDRPAHMAIDDEGRLLVVDTMNHRVQRFTMEGRYIDGFGSYGSGVGELDMPWGVALDGDGCIYVGDWRNDRVQKFSPTGEPLMIIGSSGDGDGELNRPAGVAVDQHGDIYVADRGNNRVVLFNRDGRYVEKFIGDATLSPSALKMLMEQPILLRQRDLTVLEEEKRLRSPASVRIDGDRLLIPDFGYNRVQVYRKEAYPLREDQVAPIPTRPALR